MATIEQGRPRVSVCMPNFNHARFLPERIAGLRQQTLRDFEVVVIDYGSTDGALEILKDFAARDSRVRLSEAPSRGIYANWNRCLREARGEWIYIATSDDTLVDDGLERLHAAGERHERAGIVTSLPWLIDEAGRTISHVRDTLARAVLGRLIGGDGWTERRLEMLSAMIFGTPTLSVTQMLIRRDTFERIGFFPEQYGSKGDFAWQLRAIAQVPIFHLGGRIGSWRRHAGQATSDDISALHKIRARMLLDWYKEERPALDVGMSIALGFSLALGGELEGGDVPAAVTRWRERFAWLRRWASVLARPVLVALLIRAYGGGNPYDEALSQGIS